MSHLWAKAAQVLKGPKGDKVFLNFIKSGMKKHSNCCLKGCSIFKKITGRLVKTNSLCAKSFVVLCDLKFEAKLGILSILRDHYGPNDQSAVKKRAEFKRVSLWRGSDAQFFSDFGRTDLTYMIFFI